MKLSTIYKLMFVVPLIIIGTVITIGAFLTVYAEFGGLGLMGAAGVSLTLGSIIVGHGMYEAQRVKEIEAAATLLANGSIKEDDHV